MMYDKERILSGLDLEPEAFYDISRIIDRLNELIVENERLSREKSRLACELSWAEHPEDMGR